MGYRLAIVGESRGQLENHTLREWLKRAGFNVASCWPDDMPREGRIEDVWFGELAKSPPINVPIMAVGGATVTAMSGLTLPIHKIRGSLLPGIHGGWLVAAMNPSDLGPQKGQDHLKPTIAFDSRRAIATDGPRVPNCKYLGSPSLLPDRPKQGDIVSVDIEGSDGRPNIVGVSWREGEAYVFPWSEELRLFLTHLFTYVIPTFHNAAFDIPELELAGVTPPKKWYDTIVMAAFYDPSQPMNLQTQVLTHVAGSIAWKGLVNHEKGPYFEGGQVSIYRNLWRTVLSMAGQTLPSTGNDWYRFYNNLDAAWGLALANNLKSKLEKQGRWGYYTDVLMPLQSYLLRMGNEGMPLDTTKLAEHQLNVAKWKAEAAGVLVTAAEAAGIHKPDKRKNPKPPEPINIDSPKQLSMLLYDHYGLPVIKTPKGGRCVNEEAIKDLTSRVVRGTAQVKGDKDECLQVLKAITAYAHWGHWLDTFLNPPVNRHDDISYLLTAYSLHRTLSGRLSSGLDKSDLEKSAKKVRKQQVQNIPKELRDIVAAPEGYTFVGGDYSGIEWAIAMWFVSKEFNDGYHIDMLDRFYVSEFDPHTFLADIANCLRQVAKVFTHGYTYDGSYRTLARNAGLSDAVGLAVCQAHDKAFRTRKWKDAEVKKAKKEHKIQTPLGWRVYNWAWQPKPQECLAWKVQGTAADLCKWVMRRIFDGMPQDCRLVTSTHDSFLLQVPEGQAHQHATWLKEQMQQPVPWLDGRRWRADIKIGKTWKDVS